MSHPDRWVYALAAFTVFYLATHAVVASVWGAWS